MSENEQSENQTPANCPSNNGGDEEPQIYAIRQKGSSWSIDRRTAVAGSALAGASSLLGCSDAPKPSRPAIMPAVPRPVAHQPPSVAHSERITNITTVPSGRLLVTCGADRTVKIWTLPGGTLWKTLLGHGQALTCVAISPNERFLVTADAAGTVLHWSLDNGERLGMLNCHQRVDGLHITSDGSTICTKHPLALNVWDAQSGTLSTSVALRAPATQNVFAGEAADLISVSAAARTISISSLTADGRQYTIPDVPWSHLAVSPDVKFLAAACSDRFLRVYTLPEGKRESWLKIDANVTGIRFVDNETIEAICAKGGTKYDTRRFRLTSWRPGREIAAHADAIYDCAISPDRRYAATVSKDRSLKVWKLADWSLVRTIDDLPVAPLAVALCPDGDCILSGGRDGQISVWRLSQPGQAPREQQPGHSEGVTQITIEGNKVWTCGRDSKIRLWESPTRTDPLRPATDLAGNSAMIYSVAPSPAAVASGSKEGPIRLWNREGNPIRTLLKHQGPVFSLVMHGSNQLLSGGQDGVLRSWWTNSGIVSHEFEGHVGAIYAATIDDQVGWAASCGADQSLRIWDLDNRQALHAFPTDCVLLDTHFVSSREVIACGANGRIKIFNLPELVQESTGELIVDGEVRRDLLVFVYKHDLAVVGSDKSISIHSTKTGARTTTMTDIVAMDEVKLKQLKENQDKIVVDIKQLQEETIRAQLQYEKVVIEARQKEEEVRRTKIDYEKSLAETKKKQEEKWREKFEYEKAVAESKTKQEEKGREKIIYEKAVVAAKHSLKEKEQAVIDAKRRQEQQEREIAAMKAENELRSRNAQEAERQRGTSQGGTTITYSYHYWRPN
jgi:WD40 repeat protein